MNQIDYSYVLPGVAIKPEDIVIKQGDTFTLSGYATTKYADYLGGDANGRMAISSFLAGSPVVVTSLYPHRLSDGQKVLIGGTNCTPSIDGVRSIIYIDDYKFAVAINVTTVQPIASGFFVPIADLTGATFKGAIRSAEYLESAVPNALASVSLNYGLRHILIEGQHDLNENDRVTIGTQVVNRRIQSVVYEKQATGSYSNNPKSKLIIDQDALGVFDLQPITKIGTDLAPFVFSVDPLNGKFTATIDYLVTRTLPVPKRATPQQVGWWWYNIQTMLSGKVETISRGKVYVIPELNAFTVPTP